jgi:hypothetical protein
MNFDEFSCEFLISAFLSEFSAKHASIDNSVNLLSAFDKMAFSNG